MRVVREREIKMIPRMRFLLGNGTLEKGYLLCVGHLEFEKFVVTRTVMETSSLYILRSLS